MRCRVLSVPLLLAVCLFFGASFLPAAPGAADASKDKTRELPTFWKGGREKSAARFKDTELLVRFRPDLPKQKNHAIHEKAQGQVLHSYRMLNGLEHVGLPAGRDLNAALASYRADPDVLFAEPNYVCEVQVVPDDPTFASLWGLNNTGQTGGVPDADINAPEAWDLVTGSPDVVVGIIDTGVDYTHQDLSGSMWVNAGEIAGNGIDDDGNGYVDDVHGINAITDSGDPMDDHAHGTHVAGTIAASANNGIGVAGVSWGAKLLACKFIGADGYGDTSDAVKCLDYLLELKTRPVDPVNVILSNNSWGSWWSSRSLQEAIEAHLGAGMLVVAAAGNSNPGVDSDYLPSYPAAYDVPNIISVAATDHADELASFSLYGKHSVHVAAPGVDILSTTPDNTYDTFSGTSMAAPHVSGLAALVAAQDPLRDWRALKNLVIAGGQVKSALQAKTISGMRVRAFDADGGGALSCVNRVAAGRLQPRQGVSVHDVGAYVKLSYLHINCALPNGEVVVTVGGGEQITLRDDGLGLDEAAGDGVYSAAWLPSGQGTYLLAFPGNDTPQVHVAKHYFPPIAYRDIEAIGMYRQVYHAPTQKLEFPPDAAAVLNPPFPIPFVDEQWPVGQLLVSPYGTISFDEPWAMPPTSYLPAAMFTTLVAPYWDLFEPSSLLPDSGVYWDVLGTYPHREYVIEWNEMAYPGFPIGGSFQVVFFEDSTDILFNYANPVLGGEYAAVVGVQSDSYTGTNYYEMIQGWSSLLWKTSSVVAAAGWDQIVEAGETVQFDGSDSYDHDGTIVGYQWVQTAGTPVAVTGAGTKTPSFVAPSVAGTLMFTLTVTNHKGQTGSDSVDVLVNLTPVPNAGPDQTAQTGAAVTLNGTGSADADGTIAGYLWEQTAGTSVVLSGADTATPSFTAPAVSGTLTFRLTVTDDRGATATDTVGVVVNLPPAADAGVDQAVQAGAAVALNGTGSSDPDGTIAGYLWEQTAGTSVVLSGADTATPSFTAPAVSGTLTFRLTVTDDRGATATDTVGVVVNLPPAADAGPDQAVKVRSAVSLDGAGSLDPDGAITGYLWEQTAGPLVALGGSDTATPSFTAPAATGTLTFRLTVTDDRGATAADSVSIIVSKTGR